MKIRCMNCMEEYESSENVISTCPFCHHRRGSDQMLLYALPAETVLSGRYIVGTVVSYGGFGIIYRAWDRRVGGMVAVKEYFPTEYLNRTPGEANVSIYESKEQEFESGLFSFIEEARGTAKFSTYDNIVNVIDFFRENGTAYMVMEFMEGHTLKAEIEEKGGRLPWEQAVAIGTAVMDILSVVHAENILHRDVNPNNIMINRGIEIPGANIDTFRLKVQIAECKEKTGVQGSGKNWKGETVHFDGGGLRRRAIAAIGSQDIGDPFNLLPVDPDVHVIAGSSDHTVLDVTDCKEKVNVGDVLEFRLRYGGLLQIFSTKHVKIQFR